MFVVVTTALFLATSLHTHAKFATWLGDNVVVEERVLDLADGTHVVYALKPRPIAIDAKPPFYEDAFFLVDARGNVVDVVMRTNGGDDACAAPGNIATIAVAPDNAHAITYAAANTSDEKNASPASSVCRVVVDRGHLRLSPDPKKHVDENAPLAVRAVKKLAKAHALRWFALKGTELVVAASKDSLDLWIVDRSGHVYEKQSADVSTAFAACARGVRGDEGPIDLDGNDDTFEWSGPGTAIPTCACSIDPNGLVSHCETYAGRPHSPGEIAMMDDEMSQIERDARDEHDALAQTGERLGPVEKAAQAIVDVARINRDAKAKWSAGDKDAARALWLSIDRRYLDGGRAIPAELPAPFADLVALSSTNGASANTFAANEIAEALNNLGFALFEAGEVRQALGAYRECKAFIERAHVARPVLQKNMDDAERALRKAK